MKIDAKYWALAGCWFTVWGLFKVEPLLGLGACFLLGALHEWVGE